MCVVFTQILLIFVYTVLLLKCVCTVFCSDCIWSWIAYELYIWTWTLIMTILTARAKRVRAESLSSYRLSSVVSSLPWFCFSSDCESYHDVWGFRAFNRRDHEHSRGLTVDDLVGVCRTLLCLLKRHPWGRTGGPVLWLEGPDCTRLLYAGRWAPSVTSATTSTPTCPSPSWWLRSCCSSALASSPARYASPPWSCFILLYSSPILHYPLTHFSSSSLTPPYHPPLYSSSSPILLPSTPLPPLLPLPSIEVITPARNKGD